MRGVESNLAALIGNEYIGICTHEQYFYPDYFAYQPVHFDKILRACQLIHENGYVFIFANELVSQ